MGMVDTIVQLAALFVFVAIFYGPWQTLCIDWSRQRMFEARDRLFDAAARGEVSFNSTEYKALRISFERIIRFCHELSWPRLVLYSLVEFPESDEMTISQAIDRLPPAARKVAKESNAQIARAVLLCVMGRSIVLGPLYLLARCINFMAEAEALRLLKSAERDAARVERFSHRGKLVPVRVPR